MEEVALIDQELNSGRKWALKSDPESLSRLQTLAPSVRNSAHIYSALGLVTGEHTKSVIDYILIQARVEKDALPNALKALSAIHTPAAENAIMEIARTIPAARSDAIAALRDIASESAADKIIELAHTNDELVEPAIRSLDYLYAGDASRFASAYKRMLSYALKPEILDRLVTPIIHEPGEIIELRKVFEAVNDSGIVTEMKRQKAAPEAGLATKSFNLAVEHAQLKCNMDQLQAQREELTASLAKTLG